MAQRTCSVEGCEKASRSRGWCEMHYSRWQRHGDTSSVLVRRETDLRTRVERRLGRRGPDDCWLWTGQVLATGYGTLRVVGKARRAHRLAYEIFVGPIPDGMQVCHRCDVRRCCNPAHLFLGSARDNYADMVTKGRSRPPRGETHPHSKLTAMDVVAIRGAAGRGDKTVDIARRFGVHPGTVRAVVTRTAWRHIT